MYQCLAVAYYWPNMFRDVVKYICVCDICQRTRVEQANPWNNETQSQKLRGPLLLSILWDLFRIVNRVPRNPGSLSGRISFLKNGKLICEDLVVLRWGISQLFLLLITIRSSLIKCCNHSQRNVTFFITVPPYHPLIPSKG